MWGGAAGCSRGGGLLDDDGGRGQGKQAAQAAPSNKSTPVATAQLVIR